MEFDFTLAGVVGGEKHIVVLDSSRICQLKPDDQRNLEELLLEFGKRSAVAQGLQAPVTDIHRLRSTDQRLYLYMYRLSAKTVVLGGLKVGTKRLFVRTASAELREIEPVCVLDFYVHESCQRQGVGKALFEHFLETEGRDPSLLAYDRPSPKLLAFLKKHYGLHEYVPQNNNFVVFNRYFELNPAGPSGSRTAGSQGRLTGRGAGSTLGTPQPQPIPGPRSTPPPGLAPPPASLVPPWGVTALAAPSPSALGPPPPLGNSPSLGRRWAASTFGSQPPFPSQPSGHEAAATSTSGGGATVSHGAYGAGDSLDAFSRERNGAAPNGQPHCPPPAPWEGPWEGPGPGGSARGPPVPSAAPGRGPAGPPPSSRSTYSSRPPWAVDAEVAGADGGAGISGRAAGVSGGGGAVGYGASPMAARTPPHGGHGAAPRSPLQAILSSGGAGPHTRALQEQLAALQTDGAGVGAGGGGAGSGGGAYGEAAGGQLARGTTPLNVRGGGACPQRGRGLPSEDAAGPARSAARVMAVVQRSGAGAADCLVW